MKTSKVEVEVTLEPGSTAIATVYVEAAGEAGARVAALEAMAYRLKSLSVEVQP